MKIYKIQDIDQSCGFCFVAFSDSSGVIKTTDLPRRVVQGLHVGQTVVALQDKFSGLEDYVYLYAGKMYMNTKLPILDEYSCKIYIENLASDADRDIFNKALVRECQRRNINVSQFGWENLFNMSVWDRFGRLVIKQR